MHGFEHAMQNGAEKHEAESLPVGDEHVQAHLALLAYRDAHEHMGDQPAIDLEHIDAAVQDSALTEWVGDPNDNTTLAAHYRRYVEQHPHEEVNVGDEESLEHLLHALTPPPDTLH